MSGHTIEIILSRQLADCLTVPVFIVDPKGTLLFYNVPAEEILGKRFEDSGPMPLGVWGTSFYPMDEGGNHLPAGELPLVKTLNNQEPAHKTFWIKNLSGKTTKISVTSIPIIGRSKEFTGAIAIFWDNERRI